MQEKLICSKNLHLENVCFFLAIMEIKKGIDNNK